MDDEDVSIREVYEKSRCGPRLESPEDVSYFLERWLPRTFEINRGRLQNTLFLPVFTYVCFYTGTHTHTF